MWRMSEEPQRPQSDTTIVCGRMMGGARPVYELQVQRSQDDKQSARVGDDSPRPYSRWEILVGDQSKEGGGNLEDEGAKTRT